MELIKLNPNPTLKDLQPLDVFRFQDKEKDADEGECIRMDDGYLCREGTSWKLPVDSCVWDYEVTMIGHLKPEE